MLLMAALHNYRVKMFEQDPMKKSHLLDEFWPLVRINIVWFPYLYCAYLNSVAAAVEITVTAEIDR